MTIRSRLLAPLAFLLAFGALAAVPATAGAAPPHKSGDRGPDETRHSKTVFARSYYLCYGFANCSRAGMGNAGYAKVYKRMYWRMYGGHNCTNYAAYRMVHSGLPNTRPWSGGGNATYWGTSVPKLTNGTPTVGAVAWWKANHGPAGSAGHVAYVERVVSSNEIVVSQDSWHGDFSWASITRSSGNWPSGFIHFNDLALANKSAPVVSGVAKVGSVLSSTAGTWQPSDVTVTYQWYADGVAMNNATKSTFRLSQARLGQRITVRTTATKAGYPTKYATSAATAAVLPGALTNTTAPQISGVVQVDRTLAVSPGTWSPGPRLAYRWRADGRLISGATARTLDLTSDLVGKEISATVTASRKGYSRVRAKAKSTAPVAPGTFRLLAQPSIQGVTRPGRTLELTQARFSPGAEDVTVQWLRDGEPVAGATGSTYRVTSADLGAQVSARSTLARAGYTATTTDAAPTAVVRSPARMRMERVHVGHRVRLDMTVRARGVSEVPGTMVLRTRGVREELTLRHGTAHVVLRGLPAGLRQVTVRYSGAPTVENIVWQRNVRIR